MGAFLRICVAVTALKLLLIPSYRSTDFEVHRNWLAITNSLPVKDWYYENTSEWTLDYPPLFAWTEYLLSKVAKFLDPQMLVVSNLEYASEGTIYFQRASVIVLDLVLITAAYAASKQLPKTRDKLGLFALVVGNAGLFIVDHIHFQYNGFLLGVLMWSVVQIEQGNDLMAGVLFAVLLNLKHLFVYCGPLYFAYLLRHYCTGKGGVMRFFNLGLSVVLVFAASFGPFVYMGQIKQVFERLFPFGRGLCHAYWAPNAWALYAFLDKILSIALKFTGQDTGPQQASMTGGLVGVASFAVLPQITPGMCLGLTLIFILPVAVLLYRKPDPSLFAEAVAYANLCGFVWGYHVHEKAILTVLIPLAFAALRPTSSSILSTHRQDFAYFSTVSHYSLLPLLYEPQEYPIKISLVLVYSLGSWLATRDTGSRKEADVNSRSKFASLCKTMHIVLLVCIELYSTVVHRLIFGENLPFLPLMMTSVCCAVGVCFYWLRFLFAVVREGTKVKEE